MPHVYKALAYDPVARLRADLPGRHLRFRHRRRPAGAGASRCKELVDWVKANPSQGSYGTPAAGTLPHFFAVQFARTAGLDLRHVGYRGSAAALTDLVGGQIPIVVTTTSDVLEQHKGGRIRVLATSDKQPLAVPARRADLPGGRLRHRGRRLVRRCTRRQRRPPMSSNASTRPSSPLCARPRSRNGCWRSGCVPTGTSAAELAQIQQADSELWAPAVKASGFTPEQ